VGAAVGEGVGVGARVGVGIDDAAGVGLGVAVASGIPADGVGRTTGSGLGMDVCAGRAGTEVSGGATEAGTVGAVVESGLTCVAAGIDAG